MEELVTYVRESGRKGSAQRPSTVTDNATESMAALVKKAESYVPSERKHSRKSAELGLLIGKLEADTYVRRLPQKFEEIEKKTSTPALHADPGLVYQKLIERTKVHTMETANVLGVGVIVDPLTYKHHLLGVQPNSFVPQAIDPKVERRYQASRAAMRELTRESNKQPVLLDVAGAVADALASGAKALQTFNEVYGSLI